MLTPNAGSSWRLVARFYRLAAPHRRLAAKAGTAMAVGVLLALPVPLITMHVIDQIIPGKNLRRLFAAGGVVMAVLVVRTVAAFLQQAYFSQLKVRVIFHLRNQALKHLQSLPLSFFRDQHSAYLASRVSSDCERATQGLLADSLLAFVRESLTFLVGLGILFFLHAKLTLLVCGLLPFYAISVVRANRLVRDCTNQSLESSAQSTRTLQETLSSLYVVKAFGAERRELLKNVAKLKTALRTARRTELVSAGASLVSSFIGAVAPVVVLTAGGFEVIGGRLTIGQLVAFSSYIAYLFGPIGNLVMLNLIVQGSLTALARVYELLDLPAQASPRPGLRPRLEGRIVFEQVWFGHQKDRPVLRDVNLVVEPGETVALVGRSGAGKSTLLNLLLRFCEPDQGRILLDGVDLRDIAASHLRRAIALVPQENFLLSGSVAENIAYGRPDASLEAVVQAAKLAHAHDFIQELPQGYSTILGERGEGLSVGQKQRLGIARALLCEPGILIFDEATSSIDPLSERLIQEAIAEAARDRTCIVVAHHISSVRVADRVLSVEEDGRLREIGFEGLRRGLMAPAVEAAASRVAAG